MTVLTEFRPGLWLTELALEDFAVRGALIIGEEVAVVWDTLSQPRDMQPLRAKLANRTLRITESDVKVAEQEIGVAEAPFYPRVNVEVGATIEP